MYLKGDGCPQKSHLYKTLTIACMISVQCVKTHRRKDIKTIAKVLSKITEKMRRIIKETNKPKQKEKKKVKRERTPSTNHRSSVVRE